MFLIRKIGRAKWDKKSGHDWNLELEKDEIPADALTIDLKTKENKLSFWQSETDQDVDLKQVVLAILSAGDRLDKIDYVWIKKDDLIADGLFLENTKGKTPVVNLIERHVDIIKLDYVRLGLVAKRVDHAIENKQCDRLRVTEVKSLLQKAVDEGQVGLDDLQEGIKKKLE